MRATEAIQATRRAMEICNSCRFCSGYCAVFQVAASRRSFSNADLGYMANLCHNCRNCYYACQYAPPHEFALNLPQRFAQVRTETYEEYAWPRPLGGAFRRRGAVVSVTVASCVTIALILVVALHSSAARFGPRIGPGAFYLVIPWKVMASVAGSSLCLSLILVSVGVLGFWRDTKGRVPKPVHRQALRRAAIDVLTLRNLGGGGIGCSDNGAALSRARRRSHHLMLYGLALCFGSTTLATIYDHILGWPAPYPFDSMPVVLGTLGGFGIIIGAGRLAWLKSRCDQTPAARNCLSADFAPLYLLILVATSGLLLLAFRATAAMSALLAIHIGIVLSLFVLIPYSHFIHGPYRAAALLRAAMERGAAPGKDQSVAPSRRT